MNEYYVTRGPAGERYRKQESPTSKFKHIIDVAFDTFSHLESLTFNFRGDSNPVKVERQHIHECECGREFK